jgi:hypothetical protein
MEAKLKSKYRTYFWTAAWVIAGLTIGFIFILIFNIDDEHIKIGSALLWAAGYFVLGGLAGFIFGVPRIVTSSTSPASPPAAVPPVVPPVVPPAVQPAAAVPSPTPVSLAKKIIQENTNLTQVSDWLTKVIIGAGLVQLKEIPGYVLKVATKMGYGITLHPEKFTSADPAIILCAAIIIYFLTWGFVCGYLIMRLIISALLADG